MEPSARSVRYLAIVVLPALVVWAAVSRGDIGMSPDSLFYWSAARTMYETRSVASQVSPLDYARTVGDDRTPPDAGAVSAEGSITYPLTTWPPGYPFVVAALMPLTSGSAIAAARVLAVVTLMLLIGAFALVALQLVDPRRAVFAAALAACLPFVQNTVRMMWSDALFAALALIVLALAARALGPTRRPGMVLALAAIIAAATTYVRYTGPLVVAVPVLVIGLMAIRDPGRRALLGKTVLALALYALLVAPLFARNLSVAGDMTGGERSPAVESVSRLLLQLFMAFARGFVPWTGGTVPGPGDAIVSGGIALAAWAAACTAVAITIMRTGGPRPLPSPEPVRPPMVWILAGFAALYAVVLLVLRTRWHFDFNTRMLLPAVATLALWAICAFETRVTDAQLWRVNLIAIVMTALVTVASQGAVDHYVTWRGYNHPDLMDRPVARWARAAQRQAGPGLSIRFLSSGYMIPYLHFATGGAPVAALPDLPAFATLLDPPWVATVVVLEPAARRFRCPEYQRAYERVLDIAADSTFGGQDFTAWWLSGRSAADRLKREPKELTSFQCSDRH